MPAMARRGRDQIEDESGPTRSCAATRVARPIAELVRFALSPDGVVTPDLRQRLPGRGVWVTARRAEVELAAKKGAFSRGFREKATPPADLGDLIERLMRAEALAALSFANKAGAVTAGFAKVEAEVAAGRAKALIRAREGGADGARKLAAAARRGGLEAPEVVSLFESDELDVALGRENVIHAALTQGGATENFLARCRRLRFYRADPASPAGGTEARSDLDGSAEKAEPELRSPAPGGGDAV